MQQVTDQGGREGGRGERSGKEGLCEGAHLILSPMHLLYKEVCSAQESDWMYNRENREGELERKGREISAYTPNGRLKVSLNINPLALSTTFSACISPHV